MINRHDMSDDGSRPAEERLVNQLGYESVETGGTGVIEEEKKYTFREFLKDVVETILLAVVIYAAVNFLTARYIVIGYSMEPTLHSGEYLIVEKLSYRFSDPQRGDIIVFDYPLHTEDDYVKRIIGLPGDRITVSDGLVMVNDRVIEEPYTLTDTPGEQTWIVAEGSFFVMGDNRRGSSDSRSWGILERKYIIGKVWMVYWPISEIGLVRHYRYR